MMLKLQFQAAWLIGITLLIAGCSSSQSTSSTAAPVPDSANAFSTDPQLNAVVEQSCSQCHSTGGKAPWYATVSPTYLAANSARNALNFSDWQTYDAQRKAAVLKNIEQSVQSGSMPPGDYTALDHSARLGDEQKQLLLKWAAAPAH